jgi:hypothetical protein
MIPIIPILAIAAIIGGISVLSWYGGLTKKEQKRADTLAMKWFGKQFQQLAKNQQKRIKDHMES